MEEVPCPEAQLLGCAGLEVPEAHILVLPLPTATAPGSRGPPPTWSDDLDRHEHGVRPQAFPHLPEVAFAQLPPQGERRAGSLPLVLFRGLLRVWGAFRAFARGSLGRAGSCSWGPRPLALCPCAPAHAQLWPWPGQGARVLTSGGLALIASRPNGTFAGGRHPSTSARYCPCPDCH